MENFWTNFADIAPTVGLLLFFSMFVFIVFWAMRPSKKKELQELAKIPLKD